MIQIVLDTWIFFQYIDVRLCTSERRAIDEWKGVGGYNISLFLYKAWIKLNILDSIRQISLLTG